MISDFRFALYLLNVVLKYNGGRFNFDKLILRHSTIATTSHHRNNEIKSRNIFFYGLFFERRKINSFRVATRIKITVIRRVSEPRSRCENSAKRQFLSNSTFYPYVHRSCVTLASLAKAYNVTPGPNFCSANCSRRDNDRDRERCVGRNKKKGGKKKEEKRG